MLASAVFLLSAAVAAAKSAATAGQCFGAAANPGVYSFEVGGHPAKVFNDVSSVIPVEAGFFTDDPHVIARALKQRFLNNTMIGLDNNILYIESSSGGMLIDAGNGPMEGDVLGGGTLFAQLEREGIPRDSISAILLTHGHPDHLGGVVLDQEDFEPAFPKATVYISRVEYEYWLADEVDFGNSLLPADFLETAAETAKAVLGAVKKQVVTFEFDEEPVPGFMPISTPWHTPGSVAFAIDDGDSKLVFAGDSLVHQVLSIENPWLGFVADTEPAVAAAGRYEVLDMLVEKKHLLLSGHSAFPGLMYVSSQGVNYQTTRALWVGSTDVYPVCPSA